MIPLADPGVLSPSKLTVPRVEIHSHALVETSKIGAGTRIGAFAHVCAGASIGRDCEIHGHCRIDARVRLGDRVTISAGVFLREGTLIDDEVFVGPNVSLAVEAEPAPNPFFAKFEGVTLRRGAVIGAGAVLWPGVEIGEDAIVEPGSVVTTSAPAQSVVAGNPAREVPRASAKSSRRR